jgi:hypothetical protein
MNLASLLPKTLQDLDAPQTALPRIAKDRKLTALIESIIKEVATHHDLRLADECRRVTAKYGETRKAVQGNLAQAS